MKNYMIMVFICIIFQFCKNESQIDSVDNAITEKAIDMLISDFASHMEMSDLKVRNMTFIIDTVCFDLSVEILNEDLNINDNQTCIKNKLINCPDKEIIFKYFGKYFQNANISYYNNKFLKLKYPQLNLKLRNENSVLFKFSNFYKTKNKNVYTFSFKYICGRSCGGQYYIQFSIDDLKNVKDVKIWYSEA